MVEAASSCRLYLKLPAKPSPMLERSLAQAMAEADIACVLLCNDGSDFDAAWDLRLRDLAHERDVAFLIENDAERAERAGADGIHIAAAATLYQQARDRLGQGAIVGAGCGVSRHDAMVLAELGTDYVAFGSMLTSGAPGREERADLIEWWSEIFQAPCVAWGVETVEDAERLARLGADFVALSASIWQSEDAVELITETGAALRRVRTAA